MATAVERLAEVDSWNDEEGLGSDLDEASSSDDASGSDPGLMAPGEADLGGEERNAGDSSADDDEDADDDDSDLGLMTPGDADVGGDERNAGDSSGGDDDDDADDDADEDDGVQEDPVGSSGGEGSEDERGAGAEKAGTSFARAFEKVVGTGARTSSGRDPILAASKSVLKRQRDEVEETRVNREAKKLRLEMKKRGHIVIGKKGDDPAVDAREKTLMRIATKGVVRLFNAVAKAQKQQEDATLSGVKPGQAAKLSRAAFLAELKGGKATQLAVAKPQVGPKEAAPPSKTEEKSSWSVLEEGFAGLQGGTRLKDWDKQQEDSDEPVAEEVLEGFTDSDDGDW